MDKFLGVIVMINGFGDGWVSDGLLNFRRNVEKLVFGRFFVNKMVFFEENILKINLMLFFDIRLTLFKQIGDTLFGGL